MPRHVPRPVPRHAPGIDGDAELRVEPTEERRVTVVRLCKTAPAPAETSAEAE